MANHRSRRRFGGLMSTVAFVVFVLIFAYLRSSEPTTNQTPSPSGQPGGNPQATVNDGKRLRGLVSFVPDGDTLVVRVGERDVRVRLFGIDSPEGNTKQPYATQARDYARQLADRKRVDLHVKELDQYGRTVAEAILPDGKNLNHEMVSAGYASHYKSHAKNDKTLAQLEEEARRSHRGLWADAHPTPPWQWRKEHGKR